MTTNVGNYVTSLIRTGVPIAVGWAAAWALKHGLSIDQAAASNWLVPVCTAAYYALVRAIEQRYRAAGWLLGKPVTPVYPSLPKA